MSDTANDIADDIAAQPGIANDGYELVDADSLQEHPENPRRGSVEAIEESIDANGFYGAIVVQRSTKRIIAGNHRWKAARHAGMTQVPVIWADVDDNTATRILLADNRTNDVAGYDDEALVALLQEQDAIGNLDGTGYTNDDIEKLLDELGRGFDDDKDDDDDDVLPDNEHMDDVVVAHAKDGDIWTIGNHRIICGDSTDPETFKRLMDGATADLVFTSPPYNVAVKYNEHDDRTRGWEQYSSLLQGVVDAVMPVLGNGRAVCWNIPQSRQAFPFRQVLMMEDAGLTYMRTMIWHKKITTFPQWDNVDVHKARLFRADSMFEFVFVFVKGDKLEEGEVITPDDLIREDVFYMAPSTGVDRLPAGDARTGRAGAGTIGRARPMKAHPATFSPKLVEPFANNFAGPGEIVLDPFLGAGSTIMAAHEIGRRGYGAELTPRYVDLALWRLQKKTGELPMRNGEAFNFIKAG